MIKLLVENTLFGEYNKINKAIELLKSYEHLAIKNHPEGYYVASSFGKDSLEEGWESKRGEQLDLKDGWVDICPKCQMQLY